MEHTLAAHFQTDDWTFRFVFSGALVILPFAQFLAEQHYPIFRPESVFLFLLLTAACLVVAWLTHRRWAFHTVAICWLSVMQVPYTQSLHDTLLTIKPAYLIAVSLVLFALLARGMKDNFYNWGMHLTPEAPRSSIRALEDYSRTLGSFKSASPSGFKVNRCRPPAGRNERRL